MEYEIESLTHELAREVDYLAEIQYETTVAKTDLPPYNFDWSMFQQAQNANQLLMITAREQEFLYGIAMYFIIQHPHHKGLICADCDGIVVDYRYRGKGIGTGLLTKAESVLRDIGVNRISQRYRTVYDTSPLFEKHGFRKAEIVYIKDL